MLNIIRFLMCFFGHGDTSNWVVTREGDYEVMECCTCGRKIKHRIKERKEPEKYFNYLFICACLMLGTVALAMLVGWVLSFLCPLN